MATNKVALVTASSAGLGAAIAKLLASEMRVVINYYSSRERAVAVLEVLAQIAKQAGLASVDSEPRFLSIKADMSRRCDIERLISETIAKMGRLDIVISNAGWTRVTNFSVLDENAVEADWDRCFNINVKGHLFLLQAAREQLEKNEGAFVTVASVAGVKPSGSSLVRS